MALLCVVLCIIKGNYMNSLIKTENVTLETLTNALDAAAIDWLPHDENAVYVTGHAFPAFQKIDSDRNFVVIWTYLDLVPCAETTEILDFVNGLNRRLVMLQFTFDPETHRMFGHYVLSYRDGFNPAQIIRAGRTFADIFRDAGNEGIGQRLLKPLEQCVEADEFSVNTQH